MPSTQYLPFSQITCPVLVILSSSPPTVKNPPETCMGKEEPRGQNKLTPPHSKSVADMCGAAGQTAVGGASTI